MQDKKERAKRVIGVHLGRFAPYHLGHKRITQEVIRKHSKRDTLILIGSSNVLNDRTPYTFEERKRMVNKVFPGIRILPLPDINPDILHFEERTIDRWLKQLKRLEDRMHARFIFYSGSLEDVEYLKSSFEVCVLGDRKQDERNISGTMIRALIKENKMHEVADLVDATTLNLILKEG